MTAGHKLFKQQLSESHGFIPALIGHRGSGQGEIVTQLDDAWGSDREVVKENTLESFHIAVKGGATWIETDAVVSNDDVVFLYHDRMLPSGEMIVALESNKLKSYGIPTLDEAFNSIPESVGFIIEVKHILNDIEGEGTAEAIAKALIRERVIRPNRPLLTYGLEASTALVMRHTIREANIPLGFVAGVGNDFIGMVISARRFGVKVVSAHVSSLLGYQAEQQMAPYSLVDVMAQAHAIGLEVIARAPNLQEIYALTEAGIDGVCVDNVPMIAAALKVIPV